MKNRHSPFDERLIPLNIHGCLSDLLKTWAYLNYLACPTNFSVDLVNKIFDAEVSVKSCSLNDGGFGEISHIGSGLEALFYQRCRMSKKFLNISFERLKKHLAH
ncbi:hypothetical protein RF11_13910 [Thelohanellus kitauei]|uniref:Uncharacterized protein n=1 Tax=Thelohanellus kitauei TaxID=669202 RepID=A0A0C2IVQ8_THEKT|nr:hypothetical protein RF11_13910 [Thelohanellus kitauei]